VKLQDDSAPVSDPVMSHCLAGALRGSSIGICCTVLVDLRLFS
jgi:hypothetical protein